MKKEKVYNNVSRYGDKREYKITPKGVEIKAYNTQYMRVGGTEGNDSKIGFIDFEGGPFLEVGASFMLDDKHIYDIAEIKHLRSNKRNKTATWLLSVIQVK